MDAPWGDRVFEFVDPSGYLWEISQPWADAPEYGFAATRETWFGPGS